MSFLKVTNGVAMHRRTVLKAGAALAGTFAMPGIVRSAYAEEDLKIGWIQPTTGPLASSFAANYASANIAVEEINADGGILGRKLVKVEVDDAAAPANEPIVMRELHNQGIKFVVGPIGSSQTLASLAVSTPSKIIQTGYITASEGGDGTKYPYHYQCGFTVSSQAVKYAEFLAEKTSYKKIGILVEDSAAGSSVLAALKTELPARNLEIVGDQISPLRATDMTPFLRALRSAGSEALCVFVSNTIDVAQFFVGLQRLNWKPTTVGHTGLVLATVEGLVPAEAKYDDVYTAVFKAATYTETEQPSDRVKNYVRRLIASNIPPASLPLASTSPFYDFLFVLKHAIEQTKSFDTDEIKAYLDNLKDYEGLFGPMGFTAENHTGYGPDSMALARVFPPASPLLEEFNGLLRPLG